MTRCPQCRRKYEPGIYYCEACQVSLIPPPNGAIRQDRFPPEKSSSIVNALSLRVLFDANKRRTAEILVVKTLIESAGINCYFLSPSGRVIDCLSSTDPERSNDLRMVHALAVAENDYDDARAILVLATEEGWDL
jgi:hypothetical protein